MALAEAKAGNPELAQLYLGLIGDRITELRRARDAAALAWARSGETDAGRALVADAHAAYQGATRMYAAAAGAVAREIERQRIEAEETPMEEVAPEPTEAELTERALAKLGLAN